VGDLWLNAIMSVIFQRLTTPANGGVPRRARYRSAGELSPRAGSHRVFDTL